MTSSMPPKRRIALSPESLRLSGDTSFRHTEPDAAQVQAQAPAQSAGQPGQESPHKLNRAVLQVLDGMGVRAEADPWHEGARIAQYELIRELGRGAMGRVFLARDTKLGRRVAIKFLNAGHLSERFLVEARTTAGCAHENIVVIHDVSEHDGRPFMVLEYLQGEPLSARMRQGRISAYLAVEMIIPVVRAMVCAHEFGIVHRDLKPDNIFVGASGTIKVLDFGIAKLLDHHVPERHPSTNPGLMDTAITNAGTILGTMPYMSPEQWRVRDRPDEEVDHRSDIWAVGVILFEMISGRHPLEPLSSETLRQVANLDQPMPRLQAHVPGELRAIIEGCLRKPRNERIAEARELLSRLQSLVQNERRLSTGETPYAGLSAFQEHDAHRFFGRARDIARVLTHIEQQPLVAVVGATGVGKSSLIRAGVVPILKRSGTDWDVHTIRPGRNPLANLAALIESLANNDTAPATVAIAASAAPTSTACSADRLRDEPGYLGVRLRERARCQGSRALIFVDQFEELYTLVSDPGERQAFLACLAGVADDTASPLRVILSMRSDFLDRLGEDREFVDLITNALVVLAPPERASLEMALVQPAEMAGYSFEDAQLVEDMLAELEKSPAALPLLQFTATKLWEARDRDARLLTRASYRAIGGVAGALASHADDIMAGLSAQSRRLTRAIFERLVTPERTRAIASVADLYELSDEPERARELIDRLIRARLLVAGQGQAEATAADRFTDRSTVEHAIEPTVEIVHESLIDGWPTLRRWLDEDNDKAAFLAQLRVAAKQWQKKDRAHGLLWRGEAMVEARYWRGKLVHELSSIERAYLDAVLWLAERSTRRRRLILAATVAVLFAAMVAAMVAFLWIQQAERVALEETATAHKEKERAQQAETGQRETVERLRQATHDLERAQFELRQSNRELAEINGELEQKNHRLETAVNAAKEERKLAEHATREAERQRALAEAMAHHLQQALEAVRRAAEQAKADEARWRARVGSFTEALPR